MEVLSMKVARTHEEYHYGNPLPIHAMIPTNKPVQINVQIARYRVLHFVLHHQYTEDTFINMLTNSSMSSGSAGFVSLFFPPTSIK